MSESRRATICCRLPEPGRIDAVDLSYRFAGCDFCYSTCNGQHTVQRPERWHRPLPGLHLYLPRRVGECEQEVLRSDNGCGRSTWSRCGRNAAQPFRRLLMPRRKLLYWTKGRAVLHNRHRGEKLPSSVMDAYAPSLESSCVARNCSCVAV